MREQILPELASTFGREAPDTIALKAIEASEPSEI
jgi:hypothetical protein